MENIIAEYMDECMFQRESQCRTHQPAIHYSYYNSW